jgi:regulator of protease activity HflC (stomatin/prohibitin superfamily)
MPDLVILLPILIVAIYLISSIKILAEYERGVIFRLGRVLPRYRKLTISGAPLSVQASD